MPAAPCQSLREGGARQQVNIGYGAYLEVLKETGHNIFFPRMVGEGTAFFASDWLEGLSSDWLFDLAVKRHLTFMAGCRLVYSGHLYRPTEVNYVSKQWDKCVPSHLYSKFTFS